MSRECEMLCSNILLVYGFSLCSAEDPRSMVSPSVRFSLTQGVSSDQQKRPPDREQDLASVSRLI